MERGKFITAVDLVHRMEANCTICGELKARKFYGTNQWKKRKWGNMKCKACVERPHGRKTAARAASQGGTYGSKRSVDNVCYDFQEGNCQRGDSCKFDHGSGGRGGGGGGRGGGGGNECFDFQEGNCQYGDSCKFDHVITGGGRGGGGGGNETRKCDNCMEVGHLRNVCPSPDLCSKCGADDHFRADCPHADKTCDNCGMTGHLKSRCRH